MLTCGDGCCADRAVAFFGNGARRRSRDLPAFSQRGNPGTADRRSSAAIGEHRRGDALHDENAIAFVAKRSSRGRRRADECDRTGRRFGDPAVAASRALSSGARSQFVPMQTGGSASSAKAAPSHGCSGPSCPFGRQGAMVARPAGQERACVFRLTNGLVCSRSLTQPDRDVSMLTSWPNSRTWPSRPPTPTMADPATPTLRGSSSLHRTMPSLIAGTIPNRGVPSSDISARSRP